MKVRLVPLTIIPNNLFTEFPFPTLTTMGSADLGGMLALVPVNVKMRLPPGHLGLPVPLDQQGQKEILY